jgi:hypothetical protein
VFDQFPIPEKLEVAEAEDGGLPLLGLGDLEVLTLVHGKEDCHGAELANSLLQFCALSFPNLGNNTHGDGCLLLLFWAVVGVQSILTL